MQELLWKSDDPIVPIHKLEFKGSLSMLDM